MKQFYEIASCSNNMELHDHHQLVSILQIHTKIMQCLRVDQYHLQSVIRQAKKKSCILCPESHVMLKEHNIPSLTHARALAAHFS